MFSLSTFSYSGISFQGVGNVKASNPPHMTLVKSKKADHVLRMLSVNWDENFRSKWRSKLGRCFILDMNVTDRKLQSTVYSLS